MRAAVEIGFSRDGVLVDSEIPSNRALRDAIEGLGWPLTLEETMARFKGWALGDIWRVVEERLGIVVTAETERRFRTHQLALLAADVRPVDGVVETLRGLPSRFCVASNGPHEKMRVTLGATGLLGLFEGRVFSRTDVARGKPHPDLFLHAAATLGVAAGRCLVVEDTVPGVLAGKAAGMTVWGFTGGSHCAGRDIGRELAEAGADRVFDRMSAFFEG